MTPQAHVHHRTQTNFTTKSQTDCLHSFTGQLYRISYIFFFKLHHTLNGLLGCCKNIIIIYKLVSKRNTKQKQNNTTQKNLLSGKIVAKGKHTEGKAGGVDEMFLKRMLELFSKAYA